MGDSFYTSFKVALSFSEAYKVSNFLGIASHVKGGSSFHQPIIRRGGPLSWYGIQSIRIPKSDFMLQAKNYVRNTQLFYNNSNFTTCISL